jgi:hypothetical protein
MLIQQRYGLGANPVLSFGDRQLLVVAIARGGDDEYPRTTAAPRSAITTDLPDPT